MEKNISLKRQQCFHIMVYEWKKRVRKCAYDGHGAPQHDELHVAVLGALADLVRSSNVSEAKQHATAHLHNATRNH